MSGYGATDERTPSEMAATAAATSSGVASSGAVGAMGGGEETEEEQPLLGADEEGVSSVVVQQPPGIMTGAPLPPSGESSPARRPNRSRRRRASSGAARSLGRRLWSLLPFVGGGGDGEFEDDALLEAEGEENDEDAARISSCDTIIHLLKGNIGTGILAMPDAIKNSGLLVGIVGLVFMSLICVHCMHMLVGNANELARRKGKRSMSYPEVAESAFSTSTVSWAPSLSAFAAKMIQVFLCITQLGFCCVYFVFVSQNIKMVVDHHITGSVDYHVIMALTLVPMLGLCSISNLRVLSPVSMIANVLQMVGLGCTFFYLVQDLPAVSERKMYATWAQYPLYFGTAIYAFEGIGVVLPLENQMMNPRELRGWNGVLNTSMVMVSCLYIAVGFFGYLKYGDSVEGSITLNLPVEQILAQAIILMMALAIFLSYTLQYYVALEIILPFFLRRFPRRPGITEYAVRYGLVMITFALAALIPKLGLFISLVGAMSSSTLALMAPPIIDTMTKWNGGIAKKTVLKNFTIFLIGFVGFLTGSYISLQNIVIYFSGGGGDSPEPHTTVRPGMVGVKADLF